MYSYAKTLLRYSSLFICWYYIFLCFLLCKNFIKLFLPLHLLVLHFSLFICWYYIFLCFLLCKNFIKLFLSLHLLVLHFSLLHRTLLRMTRRLSVLPEEGEDSATPSPSPRGRRMAPPTHLDTVALQPSSVQSAPAPPPLRSTDSKSDSELNFSSDHFSDPSAPNSPDTNLTSSSDIITVNPPSGLHTKSIMTSKSFTELKSMSTCSSPTPSTSSQVRPNELKFASPELPDPERLERRRPSPFEIAKEFFEPVTSGLFGLAFAGSRTAEEASPDSSCSPLLSPLSPTSITSQALALKSPISPFASTPSPKVPPSDTKSKLETFDWEKSPSGSHGRENTQKTSSPNLPFPDFQLNPPQSPQPSITTQSRRKDHHRSPTTAQPIDSGYSDDMSVAAALEGRKHSSDIIDKTTLINKLLESDSIDDSNSFNRSNKGLVTSKSTSTESESTVESYSFGVSTEREPLLMKSNAQQTRSLYTSLPLSQCRPLKLSKPYSKLINQVSDEEKPSPTIEVIDADSSSRGQVLITEEEEMKNEEEEEEVRRDSLTLPTAAWALFKRRRSSTTDPSPINSPVYCTPPESSSPWGSPCPSLDLQDAFNQLDNLTPFHTPRPSFSADRSPLAHDGSATPRSGCSSAASRRSPCLLTPRTATHTKTSSDDQLVVVVDGGNSSMRISSAPATPYVTPQPSPTTEGGVTTSSTTTPSSTAAVTASPRSNARSRRHHRLHYQHHRQSC